MISAQSYEHFADAVRRKLILEIAGRDAPRILAHASLP
jgi:hypothetical protein